MIRCRCPGKSLYEQFLLAKFNKRPKTKLPIKIWVDKAAPLSEKTVRALAVIENGVVKYYSLEKESTS